MVLNVRHQINKVLNRKSRHTVFVDGGLGSQILSLMMGLHRKELDSRTRIDTTYFRDKGSMPVQTESGLTDWPWELSPYGFEPEDFDFALETFPSRPSFREQYVAESPHYRDMFSRDWRPVFPLISGCETKLEDYGVATASNFGVVHLRRGDYLHVSSRVVTTEEVVTVLSQIRPLVPNIVYVLSDASVTPEEMSALRDAVPDVDIKSFTHSDIHVVHGLMRLATFLVTSNSTFSWSAAVLREKPDSIVLSPQHFYGKDMLYRNAQFQSNSEWMLAL